MCELQLGHCTFSCCYNFKLDGVLPLSCLWLSLVHASYASMSFLRLIHSLMRLICLTKALRYSVLNLSFADKKSFQNSRINNKVNTCSGRELEDLLSLPNTEGLSLFARGSKCSLLSLWRRSKQYGWRNS